MRLLKPNNFTKVFEIQEKAVLRREKAELKAIDKQLKNKNVSPSTHQMKRQKVEVWVTQEKQKIDQHKKEFTNVFTKTIEMVENTMKNKEHIKKLIESTKVKRPDVFTEYANDSFRSYSSRSLQKYNNHNKDTSFNSYQYVKLFKPAMELSLESLSIGKHLEIYLV